MAVSMVDRTFYNKYRFKICLALKLSGLAGESIQIAQLIRKRIAHQYSVLALWAGRNQRHRAFDQFLHALDVFDRLRRKVSPTPRACGCPAPAVHFLVDRLDAGLVGGVAGEIIEHLRSFGAAQPVAGADLHLFEPVEHVDFGQGDAGDARNRAALPDQYRVEPAAAAFPAGDSAEFMAA